MNITQEGLQMAHKKIVPGTGGEHYIPYKECNVLHLFQVRFFCVPFVIPPVLYS